MSSRIISENAGSFTNHSLGKSRTRELVALTREDARVRSLQLDGLGVAAGEILKEKVYYKGRNGQA